MEHIYKILMTSDVSASLITDKRGRHRLLPGAANQMPKSSANRFLFIRHRRTLWRFWNKTGDWVLSKSWSRVMNSSFSINAVTGRCGTNLVKLQPKLYQILFTIHMQHLPPPLPSPPATLPSPQPAHCPNGQWSGNSSRGSELPHTYIALTAFIQDAHRLTNTN